MERLDFELKWARLRTYMLKNYFKIGLFMTNLEMKLRK